MSPRDPGVMTPSEHRAMDLTANLVDLVIGDVIARGPGRDGDVREFVATIHVIQKMILGQAAARAYPDRYRLLGGWPPGGADTPGYDALDQPNEPQGDAT